MNARADNRVPLPPQPVQAAAPPDADPIPREDFYQFTGPDKHGAYTSTFYAFNTAVMLCGYGSEQTCHAAFAQARDACRVYERLFSRTLPHSDISRINDATGAEVRIDPRTYDLLAQTLHYCACSEGTFDITIGPLVRLWDFKRGIIPDASALAQAARHVDWHALKLRQEGEDAVEVITESDSEHGHIGPGEAGRPRKSGNGAAEPNGSEGEIGTSSPMGREDDSATPERARFFARLADPRASLDVGGIAKGWIADALVNLLRASDMQGLIVNLGGNVAAHGRKPTGEPWRIGIRDPRDPHDPSKLLGAVPLACGSAVTSGVYERCFIHDGVRYHHILNPKTGMPAQTDVAGVTVITEKSIDAEGFSTTLLALGKDRAGKLARQHPEIIQVVFADEQGRASTLY